MPDTLKTDLADLRDRIDRVDIRILEQLRERLAVSRSIGLAKAKSRARILDTRREYDVLKKVLASNFDGALADSDLLQIYKSLISASRKLQQRKARKAEAPALFAVFGDPIGHSLSPLMHTAAFWASGYNGTYFPVEVKSASQIATGIEAFGLKGGSVTIPHKTAIIPYLDELDEIAQRTGAVNTIVNQNEKLKGFNTDCAGVVRALSDIIDLKGKSVALVGAGGAARAAAVGIKGSGAHVTISNRTEENGARLAGDLNCRFISIEKLSQLDADILINATPVGMTPFEDGSVVPAEVFRKGMLVMDMVYSPIQTRMLKEAAKAGCDTIDGSEMFIYQGALQFELWTGMEAPVDIMRLFVQAALQDRLK